ncbi:hypothetical protein K7X08_017322 [Anisodus acutangulus]|uniref:Uncharacterized protein n=1 Tax=Anisodus acutangulus TaxID=402998 RepID=A0A9Q1R689_9SOLA|nr:hypothetical protein K7X08_017322 [Anisodus acutangulus]
MCLDFRGKNLSIISELQLLEEKHGLSGRHYTALKKQEEEKDQSKTNLTLSSAIEEVQHKGTLMERLAVLETRVLQLSLDMNEGNTSRPSTSTGPVSFFERSVTIGQVQEDKANLQQSKGHHLAEKCLTSEVPLTEKTEQSTITNKSRIKRRISHRKWLGWLRLGC